MGLSINRSNKNRFWLGRSPHWPPLGILFALIVAPGCKDGSLSKTIDGLGAAKFLGLKQDQPPVFQAVSSVSLEPKQPSTILLTIDRQGNEGPVRVSLEGVPVGIAGVVGDIPAGSSSTELTLCADASLGDDDLVTTCAITASIGTHTARIQLPIQVPRVPRPSISIDNPFILQPGKDITLPIPIQRNGWQGPIELASERCPEGVAISVSDVSPEERSASAHISVAMDVAEGMKTFLVAWTSYGRKMTAEVPLIVSHTPLIVESPIAVALKASESQEVRIRLGRPAYQGPVTLALGALPANIQAFSADIQAGENDGMITVNAAPSAPGQYVVTDLRATGGHLEAEGLFVIRILDDMAAAVLPPAFVAALPGGVRPRAGGIEGRLSENAKESLDRFYGTTRDSKRTVTDGLRWLASAQAEDGGWDSGAFASPSPTGFSQGASSGDDDSNDPDGREARAVLPFLAEGIGHEPQFVRAREFLHYAEVVKKSLVFLAKRQVAVPGPDFGRVGKTLSTHSIALTAFSEAYALSENEKLKQHAKKAADYLLEKQAKNGGWEDADGVNALVTAEAMVALRTAKVCKVGVSSSALRKAEKFLTTCFAGPAPNRGSKYSIRPGDSPDAEATAAGILAALYAISKPSPDIFAGCDFLTELTPTFHGPHTDQTGLFLVFSMQALRNVEGEGFDRWNAAIRTFLTKNQVKDGELSGSWNPDMFSGETDRIRASSLAILTLQSNYRYLPLFRTANSASERPEARPSDDPAENSTSN